MERTEHVRGNETVAEMANTQLGIVSMLEEAGQG